MIHHVYANRSNVGDWLAARGIQQLLGTPVREHLGDTPFVGETKAHLREAADGDVVVIGGGGLFMDYFDPLWEALAEVTGRLRVVIWGAGVVDLKQEPSLPASGAALAVAQRAELCVVRDARTAEFLGRGEVVACPSLVALAPVPLNGGGLVHSANYTTVGPPAYERMRAAGQAFAEATGRMYRETANQIERDATDELTRVILAYAKSDLVLSSRLHGCLISFALGRPVLAVSGDRKVDALMGQAGLADWVLDWDELDGLEDRLHELESQPSPEPFVVAARDANAGVARRVLALAA